MKLPFPKSLVANMSVAGALLCGQTCLLILSRCC